jgi:hypothetical protein
LEMLPVYFVGFLNVTVKDESVGTPSILTSDGGCATRKRDQCIVEYVCDSNHPRALKLRLMNECPGDHQRIARGLTMNSASMVPGSAGGEGLLFHPTTTWMLLCIARSKEKSHPRAMWPRAQSGRESGIAQPKLVRCTRLHLLHCETCPK